MDISVELVAVLPDGELLVVVDRNVDFLGAYRLIFWVVELRDIRMSQCLFCGQALVRVELE